MSATCTRIDARAGDSGRVSSLVNYITAPEKENGLERVVYVQANNMLADKTHDMIAEMRALADAAKDKDSRVSADPFEHYVISFEHTDAVTVQDFERAREIALKHLGLEHHHNVSAIHADTDHLHMHLIVSRIDPETLDAKTIPFPVKQAEMIGARINHALYMPPVENNRYRVNEQGGLDRIEQSAVKQPDQLRDIIKGARSWQEFHERTQAIGINYERKGSGALINGEKASDVDRNASLAKLVKKFGEYEEYKPNNEATTKQPTQQQQEKLNESKFNAKPDLIARKIFASNGLRKLSECGMAQSKQWKSTSLLQDNARSSEREPSRMRRSVYRERAEQREIAREELADKHRQERSAVFDKYKQRKTELRSSRSIPSNAKLALASVIAAEQAQELASLRSRQKQERDQQRKDLNQSLPLLQKQQQQIANEFATEPNAAVKQIEHRDIRDYKPEATSAGVEYARSENARADFIDRGRSVQILNSKDDAAVLAALQLSQAKFGKQLHVHGSDEFKAKAVKLAVENNITIANPELQQAITQERERLSKERQAMATTKYETLTEFERLADAVPADRWRVTLGSYTDKEKTSVLRDESAPALNAQSDGKGNDGLSLEQVKKKWGFINFCQNNEEHKSRVILTPASDKLHIVHVDDVSNDSLKKLQEAGFKPAAIIETSPNKHNVILTFERDKTLTFEQQKEVQKQVSQALNKQYGDPDARNAMQPFRAPAFDNRKPKYKDENGQFPKITLRTAQRQNCPKMGDMLRVAAQRQQAVQSVNKAAAPAARVSLNAAAAGNATKAYLAHVASIRKDAVGGKLQVRRRKDGSIDQSSVDVLAAQRMRMTGWQNDQIAGAVANGCNTVRQQNGDPVKRGVAEFGQWAAGVAAKVDLTGFAHQTKYRVKDEAAAGITSPIKEREQQQKLEKQQQQAQAKENAPVSDARSKPAAGRGERE
jgi:hypothetical protein